MAGTAPSLRSRGARQRVAAIVATCALALAGCTTPPTGSRGQEFLVSFGLSGMDTRGIVDYLDSLTVEARPQNLDVTVHPTELVLADPDHRMSLPMPPDSFYLAIAPFINHTHDCGDYSPILCQGELRNAAVEVTITDEGTGETLVAEQTMTFDNGFIGYWLPRNIAGSVDIVHTDFTGTSTFTTGEDAVTCLTDLHLHHRGDINVRE